jgi:hypothetical protein
MEGLPSNQPIPLPSASLFKRYLTELYRGTQVSMRKKEYRRLMLEWHPDKMRKLAGVLSDPQLEALTPRVEEMAKEINTVFSRS